MDAGITLLSSAIPNRDLALAAETGGRATATLVSGTFPTVQRGKEHTMPTNHRSNAARATAPRLGLVAIAAAFATLAALAVLLLHPTSSDAAQAKGAVVSTASTSLGRILVNSNRHTLYLFGKDRNGRSACAGMCATFWPPLITSGTPRAAGGAKASKLGTTRRADGRLQVTYNRHPLYMFVKDKKRGQTNGEGVNAFGAEWDAISPAGAKVEKRAPATGGYGP
jgi:predicted lipoprotein with Yx(FWY)xxD motif